jgi:nucleotide-binding universal stress UspA family protein
MERILVGYDGSDSGVRAARQAAELGAKLGWQVTVLVIAEFLPGAYGVSPAAMDVAPPMLDTDSFERLADEGVAICRELGAQATGRLEWGHAADRIIAIAEGEGYRMIVLGHRGASGLESLLMGSVSQQVIDRAHCSVLVVR